MRLYNKGSRSMVVLAKDVISGGRRVNFGDDPAHVFIDRDTEVEVTEAVGKRLTKDYPNEFLRTDNRPTRKRRKASASA